MARMRVRWLAAVAVLAVGACGQAISDIGRRVVSEATPNPVAEGIFKHIGVTPPPSATIEYAEFQNGLDDNGRIIMVMPAADWAAMQAAPPLNTVAPDAYAKDAAELGSSSGKWRPDDEPSLVGAQVRVNEGFESLNIGVADAGAGRVRVYLFWFQM